MTPSGIRFLWFFETIHRLPWNNTHQLCFNSDWMNPRKKFSGSEMCVNQSETFPRHKSMVCFSLLILVLAIGWCFLRKRQRKIWHMRACSEWERERLSQRVNVKCHRGISMRCVRTYSECVCLSVWTRSLRWGFVAFCPRKLGSSQNEWLNCTKWMALNVVRRSSEDSFNWTSSEK